MDEHCAVVRSGTDRKTQSKASATAKVAAGKTLQRSSGGGYVLDNVLDIVDTIDAESDELDGGF
jgi:hypothetical protein